MAPPPITPNSLRVMTLNAAHGRAEHFHQLFVGKKGIKTNLDNISKTIKRYDADILALQEIDGVSIWSGAFDHSQHLAQQTELKHHVRGSHVQMAKLDYGTSVMSKYPIREYGSHTFSPSPPLPAKGFVWADIDHPQLPRGLRVISLHLDFARKGTRQKQLAELASMLEKTDRLVIVMGDFNMSWTLLMQDFCTRLNLHTFKPTHLFVTFPKTQKRLDWILVSKELTLATHTVLDDKLSDHKALIAEILLPPLE